VVQKVAYPQMTSTVELRERPAQWLPWLVPSVISGAAVVASDDANYDVSLPQ
jgi:hypothetical protein